MLLWQCMVGLVHIEISFFLNTINIIPSSYFLSKGVDKKKLYQDTTIDYSAPSLTECFS